jgi:hypothetical protein
VSLALFTRGEAAPALHAFASGDVRLMPNPFLTARARCGRPRPAPNLLRHVNHIAGAVLGDTQGHGGPAEPPSAAFGDYHERALFNGVLALQDPASGMDNHAGYGDSIYFHDGSALVVKLFIASVLHWAEQGLRLRQLTSFPEQESTRLLVQEAPRTRMTIGLRHPGWCRQATASVNGRRQALSQRPGALIEIERHWRRGDEIVLQLPMHLQLQRLPAAPDIAALMFGPLLLAARLGPGAGMPRLALRGRVLDQVVQRRGAGPLAFSVAATATAQDLELAPLHRVAHERCSLYWRLDR